MWFVVWAPPIKNPGYAYGQTDAIQNLILLQVSYTAIVH